MGGERGRKKHYEIKREDDVKGAKEGCVSAENYHATCFNLDGENGFPTKFSPLGEISA